MSTRSTISVIDDEDRYHIYRHHDGYPDGEHGVIAGLNRARRLAWPVYSDRLSRPLATLAPTSDHARIQAGEFAAAIVAAMKTGPGSVYLTRDAEAHSDRDFHYDLANAGAQLQVTVHDFTARARRALIRFEGPLDEAALKFDSGPVASERAAMLAQIWEVLGDAEYALADIETARRKGRLPEIRRRVFKAMDAHRAEKRAAQPVRPDD